ncbi:MAG: hypothetical protein Q7R83_03495 [bacterium]|nr:hypothetical protein [bacterium]
MSLKHHLDTLIAAGIEKCPIDRAFVLTIPPRASTRNKEESYSGKVLSTSFTETAGLVLYVDIPLQGRNERIVELRPNNPQKNVWIGSAETRHSSKFSATGIDLLNLVLEWWD